MSCCKTRFSFFLGSLGLFLPASFGMVLFACQPGFAPGLESTKEETSPSLSYESGNTSLEGAKRYMEFLEQYDAQVASQGDLIAKYFGCPHPLGTNDRERWKEAAFAPKRALENSLASVKGYLEHLSDEVRSGASASIAELEDGIETLSDEEAFDRWVEVQKLDIKLFVLTHPNYKELSSENKDLEIVRQIDAFLLDSLIFAKNTSGAFVGVAKVLKMPMGATGYKPAEYEMVCYDESGSEISSGHCNSFDPSGEVYVLQGICVMPRQGIGSALMKRIVGGEEGSGSNLPFVFDSPVPQFFDRGAPQCASKELVLDRSYSESMQEKFERNTGTAYPTEVSLMARFYYISENDRRSYHIRRGLNP